MLESEIPSCGWSYYTLDMAQIHAEWSYTPLTWFLSVSVRINNSVIALGEKICQLWGIPQLRIMELSQYLDIYILEFKAISTSPLRDTNHHAPGWPDQEYQTCCKIYGKNCKQSSDVHYHTNDPVFLIFLTKPLKWVAVSPSNLL